MGFSRPVEEEEEEVKTPPELPPEFQPLMERMEEQENRYERELYVKNLWESCCCFTLLILGQSNLRLPFISRFYFYHNTAALFKRN